jgi:hypothetical protein
MVVFGEYPGHAYMILGGTIVIGSGLFTLYRERVQQQKAKPASPHRRAIRPEAKQPFCLHLKSTPGKRLLIVTAHGRAFLVWKC